MRNIKSFSRYVRQELSRISTSLKQIEFKVLRIRGFMKRKLREKIIELKRMKDAIMHKLSEVTAETKLDAPTMQSIREDIELLHVHCRKLKAHRF